jgi:M6 family metalloprotease-like protein
MVSCGVRRGMTTRRLMVAVTGSVIAVLGLAGTAHARAIAPVVDVTAESGSRLVGELASWRTNVDGRKAEYLAGRTSTNQLTVLTWTSAAGRWVAENVSAKTGRNVAGSVTAWQTRDGPYRVEHLAGRAPDGRLLVFYRSTRNGVWKVVDVTAKTGRRIADTVTSWQTPNGPYTVEHLAGRDGAGNLLVFWWSPAHDWQALNISARTGRRIASPVTAWQRRSRGILTEYLAATGTDGRLDVFSWAPTQDWRVQVVGQRFPAGVTSWLTGSVEHLAGARRNGTLVVLWRHGGRRWKRVDVTALTGERIAGRLAAYQVRDGSENVELLGARSPSGHLILHWWKPSRDWQALDLTDVIGHRTTTLPAAWLSRSGDRTVEHLSLQDGSGRLRIVYSFDQPRTLTDAVADEAFGVKRVRGVRRKVLLVLWDPHYPEVTRISASAANDALFGSGRSVRRYYLENSGGQFTIDRARTLGWYEADKPLSYYDNPTTPHDKMGAALIAADNDVDYASYDKDGDKRLEPNELTLVFAHPGGPGGLIRGGGGSRKLKNMQGGDLRLDDVLINDGVEVAIGNPANFPVVAHELGHLLLRLPDMYINFFTPTAAKQYSLMDNTYSPFHLDPFAKLKLGWAHPRLVFRSGRYSLPDIETRRRVYVLLDPRRGTDEYYLLENRWPGTSFDAGIFDQGVGVWHVMEQQSVFSVAPPPPTVSGTSWMDIANDWGRSAIRLTRPVLAPPVDDSQALWAGDDPDTSYDLVSNDPNPAHPSLKWGEVTPSGFTLRSFGIPGPNLPVTVTVP